MSLVLHVVPVGLSIDHGIGKAKSLPIGVTRGGFQRTLHPEVMRARGGPERPVRDAVRAATGDACRLDLDALPGAFDMVRAAHSHPKLCAEWESVHEEMGDPPPGDPHDGHAYVFIGTDTELGLRAGVLIAAGTAGSADPPSVVRYVDDPDTEDFRATAITPGDVYLCRVPGLDLAKPDGMTDATWRALGGIGHVIAESARRPPHPHRWRVVLHLSGGYKAMIPYLLAMGEAINSVFCDRELNPHGAEIRAWALYEWSEGARVPLPVRALRDDPYQDLYTLREKADRNALHEIHGGNLIGACLDKTGTTPTPSARS